MISKIVAILVILGSMLGGFMIQGGNLGALFHPAELLVILGIALGVFLGSTPVYIWMKTGTYIGRYFMGGRVNKAIYEQTLSLLDDLARTGRAEGMLALEKHVVTPDGSSIFAKYPLILKHRELKNFIADNFSYLLLNPPQTLNFEKYLEAQIEDIIASNMEVPKATGKIANLLPGFGIIAAVMGVILTMRLLSGDMDVGKIGYSIGAALVGTLSGIFFAFAVVAPFTHAVEIMVRQDRSIFDMTASFMVAFAEGVSPSLAYEIGRQRVPPEFELERKGKG